jgi:hypothetical protein
MTSLRRFIILFLATAPMLVFGQSKGAIKQAIEAKYILAQPTTDHRDITAPGAVIDLLKDDFTLSTVAQLTVDADGNPLYAGEPTTTYKNGKLRTGGYTKFMSGHSLLAGEKCWLISVEIKDDSAVLEFLSDPIDGARFRGFIKYPFPKGEIPAPDAVLQQIGETIKAEPMNATSAGRPAAPAAPVALAAIPPPPPPADAPVAPPKSISLGQSKAQVAATFGPPTKVVILPTKEIDYFADMKVTFVKGKVSDVQ